VVYLQVSLLGGSRDETWRGQRIRKHSVLRFVKFEICRVTKGGHIEHLQGRKETWSVSRSVDMFPFGVTILVILYRRGRKFRRDL
jgi:hypothetical protein